MRNKIKTFLKDKKKEIIMIGAVLTTASIGGFIGARTGIESGFHRMKFEINLLGPDGTKTTL